MPHSKGRQRLRKGWENSGRISFLTDGGIKSDELQLGSSHFYQMEEDLHSGTLTHSSTDRMVLTPMLSMMSKLLAFIINWWIQNSMNSVAEGIRHSLLSLHRSEGLVQFNSALCLGFTRVKLSSGWWFMNLGRGIRFKLTQAVDQTDFLVVVTPMTLGICWLFVGSHFWFLEAAYLSSHTCSTATLWRPEAKNPDPICWD